MDWVRNKIAQVGVMFFSADEQKRASYRRLLAWTVATGLVYVGAIDGMTWGGVTAAFILGDAYVRGRRAMAALPNVSE